MFTNELKMVLWVMKILSLSATLTLASALLFISCKEKPPVHAAPEAISIVIGNPVDYGSQDYLLFPVGGNYNPEMTEPIQEEKSGHDNRLDLVNSKRGWSSNQLKLQVRDVNSNSSYMWDKSAAKEYGNGDETSFDIRNLLFFNKNTGESYPLVEDTIHILSFAFHYEFKSPLVFYRVVKKDINGDDKYNSKDAVMLYMSDTMGRNFTQITPPNEQLITYFYYPETQKILVKTAIDIDKNKKFTSSDETNFREVNLANPSLGRPIFSDSLKANLKSLMY